MLTLYVSVFVQWIVKAINTSEPPKAIWRVVRKPDRNRGPRDPKATVRRVEVEHLNPTPTKSKPPVEQTSLGLL